MAVRIHNLSGISASRHLMKLHVNLGHPGAKLMQNVLRKAGAPKEIVAEAGRLNCQGCRDRERPKLSREATISASTEPGAVLLSDQLGWHHPISGHKCVFLPMSMRHPEFTA